VIGASAAIAGGGVSALGTIGAGKAKEQAYESKARSREYEALQLDEKGRLERESGKNMLAQAQSDAGELKHKKELALSTLQARGAASGFSATDASSLKLAEDISGYGTLQEERAVAGGTIKRAGAEAQARTFDAMAGGARYEAAADRIAGRYARKASRIDAASTILGAVSNLALRFGGTPSGTPSGTSASASPYRFG
jgi:hypothetical protein